MSPISDLPDLRIVRTQTLRSHEEVEQARVEPIMLDLQNEGVLKNPPLVMRLHKRLEQYLVLDGANRTMALKLLDLPYTLVQLVRPGIETIHLQTWNRVVLQANPKQLFDRLDGLVEITPAPRDHQEQLERIIEGVRLAYLYLPDGSTWEMGREREAFGERMRRLGELIEVCNETGKTERTNEIDIQALTGVYDDLAGILAFHPIEVEEVIEAAMNDIVLPAGLTRFIVSPRALRVNYPLMFLAEDGSLEQKQARLDEWIQNRVREQAVRYYAEPTIVFDD